MAARYVTVIRAASGDSSQRPMHPDRTNTRALGACGDEVELDGMLSKLIDAALAASADCSS